MTRPAACLRKFRITGRVQGVGMRYWVCGQCARKGIGGWVRNERDGSVTALLAGSAAQLAAAASWLGTGPASAAVAAVEVLEPTAAERAQQLPGRCTVVSG